LKSFTSFFTSTAATSLIAPKSYPSLPPLQDKVRIEPTFPFDLPGDPVYPPAL